MFYKNACTDLVHYEKPDTEGLLGFVEKTLKEEGVVYGNIADIKRILSVIHDWSSRMIGYIYELRGVDLIDLSGHVIQTSYHHGDEMNQHESDGHGFQMFVRRRIPDMEKRFAEPKVLNDWERERLHSWFEYYSHNADQRISGIDISSQIFETIAWCYFTFVMSSEGNSIFFTSYPWAQDIEWHMDNWIADVTKSPYKFTRQNCVGQINGVAILANIPDITGGNSGDDWTDGWEDDADENNVSRYTWAIRMTDEILVDLDEIIITGRSVRTCKFCGRELKCVEIFERTHAPKANDWNFELEDTYFMCRHCAEQAMQAGIKFNDEGKNCYSERCPSAFLRKMAESNMSVEHAYDVVYRSMKYKWWNNIECPVRRDLHMEARLKMMANAEPNKLRHMAAYVLTRNACLANRFCDEGACKDINHNAVQRWFLTLRQEDFEERMRLGTYKPNAQLM